jgi:aryl-alcohol dehydrogenase-like predicted oxidoreductase
MTSDVVPAAGAGTWKLGDLTINRMGFGAMRLPQSGRALAGAHGVTAAQARLAWTLQHGPHVLAIPGTSDPAHLAANVAASALRLTREELACWNR